jgi:hypothetical protein
VSGRHHGNRGRVSRNEYCYNGIWFETYLTWMEIDLFSTCGYNTLARQDADKKNKKGQHTEGGQWTRCAPYDFTGCLAHADITYDERSGEILRIIGFLEHNADCRLSIMKRMPSIPLHPHVVEVALEQLRNGSR